MKKIAVLIIIIFSLCSNAQNKKEQILHLQTSIDSLKTICITIKEKLKQDSAKYNFELEKNRILSLEKETNFTNQISGFRHENDSLINKIIQLEFELDKASEQIPPKLEITQNPSLFISDIDLITLFDVSLKELGDDFIDISSENLDKKPMFSISSKLNYKIGRREFILASLGIENPNKCMPCLGKSHLGLFELKDKLWVKIDCLKNINYGNEGGFGKFKEFRLFGKNNICGIYEGHLYAGSGYSSDYTNIFGVFKDKIITLFQKDDLQNNTDSTIDDIKSGTEITSKIEFENCDTDFCTIKLTEYRNKKLFIVKKYRFAEENDKYELLKK